MDRVWIVSSVYREKVNGKTNWATAVFSSEGEARKLEEHIRDNRTDMADVFVMEHPVATKFIKP